MRLKPECPRCSAYISPSGGAWACPTHQTVVPLWRVREPCYEAFAEHLVLSRGLPTWLPWPMPVGWEVADFGCVGGEGMTPQAVFVTCVGMSEVDGPLEVTAVTEEPGVGLGARCAGVPHADPGQEAGQDAPPTRVRIEHGTVPAWLVSTSEDGGADLLDRAVLAGEAYGRWLWLVLRPGAVVLSLDAMPPLVDVGGFGAQLVALPFGRRPPSW